MKKILVTMLVSVFFINQMPKANAGETGGRIFEKLAMNQLQAQFNLLSDNEQNKLFEDSGEELSKVADMVSNMSNDEFKSAMANAGASIKNSIFNGEELLNNISNNEKDTLVSQIDEETLMLTSSNDEALKVKMASEFEKQKIQSINKINGTTKTSFVEKIKSLKNSVKDGIHEDKPPVGIGAGAAAAGVSAGATNMAKLKFIMYFVILGVLVIAIAFLVPGIVYAATWAWVTGACIIGVSIIAALLTKYIL